MTGLILASCLACVQDASTDDEKAKAALAKLAERFRKVSTLSADFKQVRRTELLDEPITSTGRLLYRRDPEILVFLILEPRRTEIHFDRKLYQVYRPEDKQLERFEFEDTDMANGLFMAFNPSVEKIGKTCSIRLKEAVKGELAIELEPTDEKFKKMFRGLTLRIAESDGSLRGFKYKDADGDEVEFELTNVSIDPKLEAGSFELKVPDGVRILNHKVKK